MRNAVGIGKRRKAMTPEFREKMTERLTEQKEKGFTAPDALRQLEIACGKANEEFAGEGMPLVEKVFDGYFEDRQSWGWRPNERTTTLIDELLDSIQPEPLEGAEGLIQK